LTIRERLAAYRNENKPLSAKVESSQCQNPASSTTAHAA
jgi:hypothetical protein